MEKIHFSLIFLLFPALLQAQIWRTGDNSTCSDCDASCKTDDVACWQKSLTFFEKTLIAQLRNYISAQVDYDQWHRRHEKPKVQDYNALTQRIGEEFHAQLHSGSDEVLEEAVVANISAIISARIVQIATSSMDKVPLYECPVPCSEREKTVQLTFGLSLVLNCLAAVAVIPIFIRSIRPDDDGEKEEKETLEREGRMNNGYTD